MLKKRKVVTCKLTVSGLRSPAEYAAYVIDLHRRATDAGGTVLRFSEKSHALREVRERTGKLRLRFLSYTGGHRPDILDTERFTLHENPLQPAETVVEWTHAVGTVHGDRYILAVERNVAGIWPSTIEHYLQRLADGFPSALGRRADNAVPLVVSVEPLPGEAFMDRLNALDRVREASIRVVRPNPGWHDLESEIGDLAGHSDARTAELTLTARRRASLRPQQGIVEWIRTLFRAHQLDYASVSGTRDGTAEEFNTKQLRDEVSLEFETDERGQVLPRAAWRNLEDRLDEID